AYRIYRTNNEAELDNMRFNQPLITLNVHPEPGFADVRQAPLVQWFGLIDLKASIGTVQVVHVGGDRTPRFTGIYRRDSEDKVDRSVNYLIEATTPEL